MSCSLVAYQFFVWINLKKFFVSLISLDDRYSAGTVAEPRGALYAPFQRSMPLNGRPLSVNITLPVLAEYKPWTLLIQKRL